MNEIKNLPKEYIDYIFFKLMLSVFLVLSLAGIVTGCVMIISYLNYDNIETTLAEGVITWIAFITAFSVIVFYKKNKFKNKIHYVKSIANAEMLAAMTIHGINRLLSRLLRK